MTIDSGTPIKCQECGRKDAVRLRRGVRIASIVCLGCGNVGTMKRNTLYDQERRKKVEAKP